TAILFAAIHPDRTQGLILANATARIGSDDDYPLGLSQAEAIEAVERLWGTEDLIELTAPDAAHDSAFCRWYARVTRLSMNAKEASDYLRFLAQTDVRDVLPSLRVPSLVLQRENYKWIPAEQGRDLAECIPDARFVPVPGADAVLFSEPNAE